MSRDTVIATPTVSRLMDSTDQMMIWDWISTHLAAKDEWEGPLRFADGIDVRVHARRVGESTDPLSAILELRPLASPAPPRPRARLAPAAPAGAAPATRIAGRSLAAHRLQDRVDEITATVAPVLIVGESGVGKTHLARQIQHRWGRHDPVPSVDASTLTPSAVAELRARLSGSFACIIEHLDEVPDDAVASTRRLLDAAVELGAPVIATATSSTPDDLRHQVQTHVRRSVCIPPLRQRIEDLTDLARELLAAELPTVRPRNCNRPRIGR